jgi:hypothetical protein
MSGLKGNQKKGLDGKFVPNPVEKPLRSLKGVTARTPEFRERLTDSDLIRRMSSSRGNLGREFSSYQFTVVNRHADVSSSVWARDLDEARHVVEEWAARIKAMPNVSPRHIHVAELEVEESKVHDGMSDPDGPLFQALHPDSVERIVNAAVIIHTADELMTFRNQHAEAGMKAIGEKRFQLAESEFRKADMHLDAYWRKEHGVSLTGKHSSEEQWAAAYASGEMTCDNCGHEMPRSRDCSCYSDV